MSWWLEVLNATIGYKAVGQRRSPEIKPGIGSADKNLYLSVQAKFQQTWLITAKPVTRKSLISRWEDSVRSYDLINQTLETGQTLQAKITSTPPDQDFLDEQFNLCGELVFNYWFLCPSSRVHDINHRAWTRSTTRSHSQRILIPIHR